MSDFTPIYAVDFDGTLCESQWPGIGAPNMKLIKHLIRRRNEGAKLILWTCRVNERLDEAVEWCKQYGLEFDAVNDNLPEMVEKFGNNARKVFATCYIDDLAVNKEKYGIPFHTKIDPCYEKFDKYPCGSEWILKCDGMEIPVCLTVINKSDNWIEATSASDDPQYQYYRVRREPEWFDGKLFPKER